MTQEQIEQIKEFHPDFTKPGLAESEYQILRKFVARHIPVPEEGAHNARTNPFTGEGCELPGYGAALHDHIKWLEFCIEDEAYHVNGLGRIPMTEEHMACSISEFHAALMTFRILLPKPYMILLD